jgi:hypothetical protein
LGSNALFWHAVIHADRALIHKKKNKNKKQKTKPVLPGKSFNKSQEERPQEKPTRLHLPLGLLGLQNCQKTSLLFTLPSLRYFITAVLENSYRFL